tara:strand:+ start:6465 stop:9038 length:2574 start_codon:yes stop_codon:yes gene_type:complete
MLHLTGRLPSSSMADYNADMVSRSSGARQNVALIRGCRLVRFARANALVALLACAVNAQCVNEWRLGPDTTGVPGGFTYASTMWDPDGPGPQQPVLAMAGSAIVTYDSASDVWSSVGDSDVNNWVQELVSMPNGDLVAAGYFTEINGVPVNHIARWDGVSWQQIGAGFSSEVHAAAAMPNGDLMVGTVLGCSRWDGSNWHSLGTGLNMFPFSMEVHPNGDLLVGGTFLAGGGMTANGIARWDGNNWHSLGSGLTGNGPGVAAIHVLPNGDVIAGGRFLFAGGVAANNIARWDGSNWSAMGAGVGGPAFNPVLTINSLPNGDLVVGGDFTSAGGLSINRIARWDGAGWSAMVAGANNRVHTMTRHPNGDLFVGGTFREIGGVATAGFARFGAGAWTTHGSVPTGKVHALTVATNGDLLVGGNFHVIGAISASLIARWDGQAWSPLGPGLGNGASTIGVRAVAELPGGDVVAGGMFTNAGSVAVGRIARWDGAQWWPMAGGVSSGTFDTAVNALAVMPNGDLIVGGSFSIPGNNIARWNGVSWSWLGGGMNADVLALAVTADGDIIAGGEFTTAGGVTAYHIARWHGSSWSPIGLGTGGIVHALDIAPNGDIVAGGDSPPLARWDGATWTTLGTTLTNGGPAPLGRAVQVLPNGDLVAGGSFLAPVNHIGRWSGTTLTPLGDGVNGDVYCMTTMPNGNVVVGGAFTLAGGMLTPYLAELTTTCLAASSSYGAGCTGSAGPVELTELTLPWLGSAFRARATGLTIDALAVGVYGFSQISVPLSSGHTQGQPGCDVLVADEILLEFLAGNGEVHSVIDIPNDVSLVGMAFYHQVVPVERDAAGGITAITSSNALALTVGFF